MDAISRSSSPLGKTAPTLIVRLASNAQKDAIYTERAASFRGSLTTDAYRHKQRSLSNWTFASKNVTVWCLVDAELPDGDYRASVELHARNVYFRASADRDITLRKAAYIASLFVPPRHRGHGYARLILRSLIGNLRSHLLPVPLNDIAFVYGSTEPDLEPIYRNVDWHRFRRTRWSVNEAPAFDHYGPLPEVELVYDFELEDLTEAAAARTRSAIAERTSPSFAFVIDAEQIRHYIAHYRLNWKAKRSDELASNIIGARVGQSFAIWGFRMSQNGIGIWLLSATCDQAALALCAAATDQSKALGGGTVSLINEHCSPAVNAIIDRETEPTNAYSDGVLVIDDALRGRFEALAWLKVVRQVVPD